MIGCEICAKERGIMIKDCFKTEEEFCEHVENEHGIPVMRDGETETQAEMRCALKGIVADETKCQCGDCKRLREKLELIKEVGEG